jgi:DNA-binding MarR family transcriptional regulator
VEAFIMIATRQGKSISAYARQANVQFNHIARQIADLSRLDRHNRPGLDFVEKRSGKNEREALLYLTPRGREFARRVAAAILPMRPANPARDAAEALFGGSKAKVG